MEAYAYASSGGGMVLLLLVLGAVFAYLFFSKGCWLDKYCKDERESWNGSDVEPDYNINQHNKSIDEAISDDHYTIKEENKMVHMVSPEFHFQEKIPYTPSLEVPFEDPEVPNRPSKKKRKIKKTRSKPKYTKRSKK